MSRLSHYTVVGSTRPADVEVPGRTQRELRRGASGETVGGRGTVLSGAAPTIGSWISVCFPGGSPASKAGIEELIAEAAAAASNDYGVEAANEWADGYAFPAEFVDSDVRCLRAAQLDFRSMVERRLKILSKDRLSHASVATLSPDNPELTLITDLIDGMRVAIPEGFVPNGNQPRSPLRSSYEAVSSAVNKMLGAVIEQRLAFILPLDMAQAYVPNLHLCKAHWTTKKGKASGRPLGDLSNVDGTPLNTDATADAATAYYGPIAHPTIEDIAIMVGSFWKEAKARDPSLRYEDLRLWKMDLKGAYTLLSFRAEHVGLFGMLLTDDLVYLQLAGIFGWSGTPAAFQVVTRAISWELRAKLRSRTLMYVDDIVGIGFAKDIPADLALTRSICTRLLGSGAVADDKTEVNRRLDVIGYIIDLDTRRVLISNKNFLTALNGFLNVDTTARINLRTAQRLASWSTRYGKICRVMRPFCSALYRLTWGRTDPHALFDLSAEAVVAIQCWRAMLCLVRHRETEFTRSIASFAPETPTVVAEFDSSLSGAGLIWYLREDGAEVAMGVGAADLSFLGFGDDSSFQNLSEFLGAILSILGQMVLGFGGRSVALRGDSVTALTWAITERPRGERVTKAAMVFSLLCITAGIDVKEVTHIAGTDNKKCDRLSRRGRTPTMSILEEADAMGVRGVNVVEIDGDEDIVNILTLCDPRSELHSEEEFIRFWSAARNAIDAFLRRHGPRAAASHALQNQQIQDPFIPRRHSPQQQSRQLH